MKHTLLATLSVVSLLSGCASIGRTEALGIAQALLASIPQQPIEQGGLLTGTLADSRSFELTVAPVKARLAAARREAARAVVEKRLDVSTAKEILRLSDKADAKINLAWADKEGTWPAKLALADAEDLLNRIDNLLKGVRE